MREEITRTSAPPAIQQAMTGQFGGDLELRRFEPHDAVASLREFLRYPEILGLNEITSLSSSAAKALDILSLQPGQETASNAALAQFYTRDLKRAPHETPVIASGSLTGNLSLRITPQSQATIGNLLGAAIAESLKVTAGETVSFETLSKHFPELAGELKSISQHRALPESEGCINALHGFLSSLGIVAPGITAPSAEADISAGLTNFTTKRAQHSMWQQSSVTPPKVIADREYLQQFRTQNIDPAKLTDVVCERELGAKASTMRLQEQIEKIGLKVAQYSACPGVVPVGMLISLFTKSLIPMEIGAGVALTALAVTGVNYLLNRSARKHFHVIEQQLAEPKAQLEKAKEYVVLAKNFRPAEKS